jgi:hypothetical protein
MKQQQQNSFIQGIQSAQQVTYVQIFVLVTTNHTHLPTYPHIYLLFHLSIYLFIYLSACLSVCVSFDLSAQVSINVPTRLSVCLYVNLPAYILFLHTQPLLICMYVTIHIQSVPKRCIHKVNIPYYNVYTSFWDTCIYIIIPYLTDMEPR